MLDLFSIKFPADREHLFSIKFPADREYLLLSDGNNEVLEERLAGSFRAASHAMYEEDIPKIIADCSPELVKSFSPLYYGVYMVPMLYWTFIIEECSALLISDSFFEKCANKSMIDLSQVDIEKILEDMVDPGSGWIASQYMRHGLLICATER